MKYDNIDSEEGEANVKSLLACSVIACMYLKSSGKYGKHGAVVAAIQLIAAQIYQQRFQHLFCTITDETAGQNSSCAMQSPFFPRLHPLPL